MTSLSRRPQPRLESPSPLPKSSSKSTRSTTLPPPALFYRKTSPTRTARACSSSEHVHPRHPPLRVTKSTHRTYRLPRPEHPRWESSLPRIRPSVGRAVRRRSRPEARASLRNPPPLRRRPLVRSRAYITVDSELSQAQSQLHPSNPSHDLSLPPRLRSSSTSTSEKPKPRHANLPLQPTSLFWVSTTRDSTVFFLCICPSCIPPNRASFRQPEGRSRRTQPPTTPRRAWVGEWDPLLLGRPEDDSPEACEGYEQSPVTTAFPARPPGLAPPPGFPAPAVISAPASLPPNPLPPTQIYRTLQLQPIPARPFVASSTTAFPVAAPPLPPATTLTPSHGPGALFSRPSRLNGISASTPNGLGSGATGSSTLTTAVSGPAVCATPRFERTPDIVLSARMAELQEQRKAIAAKLQAARQRLADRVAAKAELAAADPNGVHARDKKHHAIRLSKLSLTRLASKAARGEHPGDPH